MQQLLTDNLNENIVIDTACNPGNSRRGEDLVMIALFARAPDQDLWYYFNKRKDGWRIKIWRSGIQFFWKTHNSLLF